MIFLLNCSVVQIFGSTDEEEVLHDATLYAIYFVILAIGVGSVQLIWVSHCFIDKMNSQSTTLLRHTCTYPGCECL